MMLLISIFKVCCHIHLWNRLFISVYEKTLCIFIIKMWYAYPFRKYVVNIHLKNAVHMHLWNMLCISIYEIYIVHIHLWNILSMSIFEICCAYPFIKNGVHIHLLKGMCNEHIHYIDNILYFFQSLCITLAN